MFVLLLVVNVHESNVYIVVLYFNSYAQKNKHNHFDGGRFIYK